MIIKNIKHNKSGEKSYENKYHNCNKTKEFN